MVATLVSKLLFMYQKIIFFSIIMHTTVEVLFYWLNGLYPKYSDIHILKLIACCDAQNECQKRSKTTLVKINFIKWLSPFVSFHFKVEGIFKNICIQLTTSCPILWITVIKADQNFIIVFYYVWCRGGLAGTKEVQRYRVYPKLFSMWN